MDPTNQSNPEGGNKIILSILLGLCVFIIVLLLLMMTRVWPVCGEISQKPGYGGGKAFGVCQIVECDGETCVVETVSGCCGNGICEGGEAPSECPIDCAGGGEITTTTNSEGDTYNEFDLGDELVCPPNSGESDGAICVCEENDCGDGVDNDGDGLIDCRDPDCDCLPEDCPECDDCPPCDEVDCEDSVERSCTGECPDDQRCVAIEGYDEAGVVSVTGCECAEEEYDCAQTDIAYCSRGTCPPREVCEYTAGECSCVPEEGGCEDECGQYPDCQEFCILPSGEGGQCGLGDDGCCYCHPNSNFDCTDMDSAYCSRGTCPPNYACEYVAGGCECEPQDEYDCAQTDSAYCSRGICPPGEVCEYTAGECSCVPEEVDCEDSEQLQCTGDCPPGERCVAEYGGGCKCVGIDCSDAEAPACVGDCPGDMVCEYSGQNECQCVGQSTDCEDSEYPACTGECPADEYCLAMQDSCECVEDQQEPTCTNQATGACEVQLCDNGMKCVPLNSFDCTCIPEGDYGCQYIVDTAYCSIGDCGPTAVCVSTGNGCLCRPIVI